MIEGINGYKELIIAFIHQQILARKEHQVMILFPVLKEFLTQLCVFLKHFIIFLGFSTQNYLTKPS